eukprot:gene9915-11741_t
MACNTGLPKELGITLTCGEQSENHAGMQKQGAGLAKEGLTEQELQDARKRLLEHGCEQVEVRELLCSEYVNKRGYFLHAPDGVNAVLRAGCAKLGVLRDCLNGRPYTHKALLEEQAGLEWNTQYFDVRQKKVLQKRARHNLCYAETRVEPDLERGQGTVYSFSEVPVTDVYRAGLGVIFGEKLSGCQMEGNRYDNVGKQGIGVHGDQERKIVVGARLGASHALGFAWFKHGEHLRMVGEPFMFTLSGGSLYAMSEKTTGWDFKNVHVTGCHLRHAAGAASYINFHAYVESNKKRRLASKKHRAARCSASTVETPALSCGNQ